MNRDYITDNVKLLFGDCLERMKGLPDNSASLTITSPPYNMNLRIRNGRYCSRQIVKEISTKYRNFDDNLPVDDYFEFNSRVISECLRVSGLVFFNVQFLTGNKRALFRLIGKYEDALKDIIMWDKVVSQPAISGGVLNSQFEVLLVFDKASSISRKYDKANFQRGELSNVWRMRRDTTQQNNHGAVFPLQLPTRVVKCFTSEGDSVIDPFMGLGTSGVACKNLNRKFIGIELDPEYFEIARSRITGKPKRRTIQEGA
jgi:site-specific DNA-methyltransferase (adenine-specific)